MVDVARLQVEVDSRQVKDAEDKFNRFSRSGRKAERQTKDIGRQSQRTARAMQGMNRSVKLLTGALGTLTAALSIRALQQFVVNSVNAVDQIGKAAQTAGIAAENLQELRFAFSQLAGTTDLEVDQSIRRFNRRLGLAADGSGAAKTAFEDLNISLRDSSGALRDSDSVLEDLLSSLAAIEDPSRRAAIASQAFGEDAGPRLAAALNGGIAAMSEARQEARALGLVLSDEAVQAGEELADQFDILGRQIGVRLQTAVIENKDAILGMVDALTSLIEAASQGQVLPDFFSRAEDSASGFVSELEKAGRILLTLAGARTGAMVAGRGGPLAAIGGAAAGGTAAFFTPELAGLMLQLEGREKTVSEIDRQIEALIEQERDLVSKMRPAGMAGEPRLPAGQQADLNTARSQIRELRALREEIAIQQAEPVVVSATVPRSGPSLTDEIKKQEEALKKLASVDPEFAGVMKYSEAVRTLSELFQEGFISGERFNELLEEQKRALTGAKNPADEWQKSLEGLSDTIQNQVTSSLTDMIFEAENAGEVLSNLADQIARTLVETLVVRPFVNSIAGSIGGGLGIPGFANGGNVQGNSPIIVGERGPEMFVPRQDGSIVPNHRIGGGGDVTVNIINEGGQQLETTQQQQRRGPNGELTIDLMVKGSMERLDSQGQLDGIFRRHGARRQGQF